VNTDVRPIPSTRSGDLAKHPVGLGVASNIISLGAATMKRDLQSQQRGLSDFRHTTFVHDTKDRDNILPLGLRDELGEDADIVQSALSVGHAHGASEEVDCPELATVVPA